MKRLIVNADDFGLHSSINQAVDKAFHEGILTSTSLMASGPAFEEAVGTAFKMKGIGIGIHLTLVGSIPSVLPAEEIPSLTWENGRFCRSYADLLKRDIMGKVSLQEVYKEWEAQIQKVLHTGLPVTHIDSHQHLHMWNHFFPVALKLAQKYHIHCMRVPDEGLFFGLRPSNLIRSAARDGLSLMARSHRGTLKKNHIHTNDHFFGMLYGGHLYPDRMAYILHHIHEGTTEIMCHPSIDEQAIEDEYHWDYHGEKADLQSLLEKRSQNLIKSQHIELVSYQALL